MSIILENSTQAPASVATQTPEKNKALRANVRELVASGLESANEGELVSVKEEATQTPRQSCFISYMYAYQREILAKIGFEFTKDTPYAD